ncbi:MAG: SGNH/GDSL hydrolase family protein [Lachnospiraceae bacterium]|nr:SGNH/GDSL hydrolase family protein [Lachnospiraceae bacterium]
MKKNILCFGDSNTHGYCAANGGRFDETQRWTCLLQDFLGDSYYVIEEGLNGRTTVFEDPLEEGMSGLSAIYPCMKSHKPLDLLIIMLGTNDTKERFHANSQVIAKGLERLTAKALSYQDAWRNHPNVLIIAPAPIDPRIEDTFAAGEMGAGCAEKSSELADWYLDVADRLDCHFLDAGALNLSVYPTDYMHLDARSHQKLAHHLAALIPTLLVWSVDN